MIACFVAYWRVRLGHAERICAPGKWVVRRDGPSIRVEVKNLLT